MIGMNGEEFARELEREGDALVAKHFDLLREIFVDAAEKIDRRVPVLTGRMRKSIAASIDREDKKAKGGVAQVRATFARKRKRIPRKVFLMVNDFRAGFHEHGTVKMAARPFFEPALRAQENKTR